MAMVVITVITEVALGREAGEAKDSITRGTIGADAVAAEGWIEMGSTLALPDLV